MPWRFFAVLIFSGFVAISFCEPVNRRGLPRATQTSECASDDGVISACKTNETVRTLSPSSEDQTRSSRAVWSFFLDDDSEVNEVSARKKKKKGKGRIIFYMLAAMKAALMYGLLHGIAALAGKAILLAKIALAIALAALVKKNDSGKVSYEIVKHPQTSYEHTHSSSVDYDHRSSDYNDDRNDYVYEHRKRRQLIFKYK
ncbi:hypothetical protein PUN28_016599 [Cardiocondyla obscurior]|uniref:Uncharacterized protein n=1 Tax=Cardiocondyla obscurior TaxID=286306 RepID=A0AAW2ET97_9HYME